MINYILSIIIIFQMGVEENRRCFICHGKENFGVIKGNRFYSLYISEERFRSSVHGRFSCVKCHVDIRVIPHLVKPERIHCLQCHFEGNVVGAPVSAMPEKYKESVHGRALSKGVKNAPDCKDCHTVHYVRKDTDSLSTIYRPNIPGTCGRCHLDVADAYRRSIHWRAIEDGIVESAVCSDCHHEHDILPPTDPRSTLNPKNVTHTCEKCHADVKLMKRVGVPVKQVEAFKESFHGIALEFGMVKAANCTSCHGYHDILPSSDPRSPIHPVNLARTCGKCHPNANENVAKGKFHILPGEKESGVVYYVYTFFKWFTFAVLFGLFIHIVLDISGQIRRRKR
jgi:hypothetical protein